VAGFWLGFLLGVVGRIIAAMRSRWNSPSLLFVVVSSFGLHRGATIVALGNGPATVRGPLDRPGNERRDPRSNQRVQNANSDMRRSTPNR
jgi:hypothetical protein